MRRWGIVALAGLLWISWHAYHKWHLPPTDGYKWARVDSCTWQVVEVLPFFGVAEIEAGDRLLRIDYLPVCPFERIPPEPAYGRLYLYEILRQGQRRLVFVESAAPFLFGWPEGWLSYTLTVGLALMVAVLGLGSFLIGIEWRRVDQTKFWSQAVFGGAVGACMIGFASLWSKEALFFRHNLALGMGIGWIVGFALGEPNPTRRRIFLLVALGLAGGVFIPKALVQRLAVEIGLALPLFRLSGLWQGVYGVVWAGWVIGVGPWSLAILGGLLWAWHVRDIRTLWALVPRELLLLRLTGLVVGLGLGLWHRPKGLGKALLWGLGGSLGWIGLGEIGWRRLTAAQRRVRLLEERLARLWEIVDRAALEAFVRDTLQAYAQVAQVRLVEASPPLQRRGWLRRSGESAPFPSVEPTFRADAALPLPAYGWLLMQEGGRKLQIQDLERLIPFAAGLSMVLRHLELLETAHRARLAALRGQLSPHFLFNALNTLQALISENPPLAEELIARLGALLRRSLALAERLTIPLQEELRLVEDYLEIERQRFGERLRVEWSLPVPLPEVEIPPFTLQLLAENVIKHAVSRLTRPVRLRLAVSVQPDKVWIEVTDDGPGIDPARLRDGVGLSNLILRLEQLYGPEAAFEAERLNPGTRIRICLPHRGPGDRSQNPAASPSAHVKLPGPAPAET
ncbi:MAG: histidine kinase [Bacteroidia bacterium]|nr:histidine kinase [Bacteroidia bacterium]MDW8088229.1 histidine kinase [Bacteroidia bacterium]